MHPPSATRSISKWLGTAASITMAGWPTRLPPSPSWELGTGKLADLDTGYQWELYHIAEDYSQYNDLAAKMPDKLKEMQALFATEAGKYNVFPLDNTGFSRLLTPRPSAVAGRTVFTYTGEMPAYPSATRRAFWTRTTPSPPT